MGDDNKQTTKTTRVAQFNANRATIPTGPQRRRTAIATNTGRAMPRPTNPAETIPGAGNTGVDRRLGDISTDFYNSYTAARERQMADYTRMMGQYGDWRTKQIMPLLDSINSREPHNFTFERINPTRSPDTDFAMQGYKEFANTGGYSPTDIQELRARGVSPIRAAYGNAMMEIDRSASLGGGAGYAPNRIAAISRMNRELPGQMADATTTVNAQLADAIRSGKLSGLAGVMGISEAEAGRLMQAAMANQGADIQTQGMTEDAINTKIGQQFAGQGLYGQSLDSERSLYGTTPALATAFGNQALAALQLQQQAQLSRENMTNQNQQQQNQLDANKVPWWQRALGIAGTLAPIATSIWDRYRGNSGNSGNTGTGPYSGGATPSTGSNPGRFSLNPILRPGFAGVGSGEVPSSYSFSNRSGNQPMFRPPTNSNSAFNRTPGQIPPEGTIVNAYAGNPYGLPPGKYRVQNGQFVKVG